MGIACMTEMTNAYKITVGKWEQKRPFWRPRHTWEDNIKMGLKDTGCKIRKSFTLEMFCVGTAGAVPW